MCLLCGHTGCGRYSSSGSSSTWCNCQSCHTSYSANGLYRYTSQHAQLHYQASGEAILSLVLFNTSRPCIQFGISHWKVKTIFDVTIAALFVCFYTALYLVLFHEICRIWDYTRDTFVHAGIYVIVEQ